jgi:hypothetical protein
MKKDEMKKKILFPVVISVMVSLWSASTAMGDELDDLKQQVTELQNRITQLEEKQRPKKQSFMEKASEAKPEKANTTALPESLKWAEKVKVSGDLRYRQDHKDEEDSMRPGGWEDGIYRHRIRARLMFEAIVNNEWDVAFRIASGNDRSPISTNQDLEDAFSKKYVWLDLGYFNWHPARVQGLNLTGGKIKNPFYTAGKNQLIWDSDLNPEGIALKYCKPLNDTDQFFFNSGGFWVDESSNVSDISLWGAQAYLKRTVGNPDHVLAGATYYDYGNIESKADLRSTWGGSNFFGNTTSGGLYKDDFNIVEIFGEYGFKYISMPTTLFASWVQNIVATTSEDTGWLVGVKFNKAKDDQPGSWEFGYDYRETDADAVIGGFNESDFLGAQTNSRGHRFVLKYHLAKNLYWNMTYYHLEDTRTTNDLGYRRFLGDLVWKF